MQVNNTNSSNNTTCANPIPFIAGAAPSISISTVSQSSETAESCLKSESKSDSDIKMFHITEFKQNKIPLLTFTEAQDSYFFGQILKELSLHQVNLSKVSLNSNEIKIINLLNSEHKIDATVFDTDTDIYTRCTFKELIEEQKAKQLPYFLAQWINPDTQASYISDGISFLKNYYLYQNSSDPITKIFISTFNIYKSTKVENEFKFFCSSDTLRANNDEKAKIINACNTEQDFDTQGKEAFFVVTYYEKKNQDMALTTAKHISNSLKSKFWLSRAITVNNPDAYWHLGLLYLNEMQKNLKNNQQMRLITTLFCFTKAMTYVDINHKNYTLMKNFYIKLISTFSKNNYFPLHKDHV